jgi:hypothetical protein
MISARKAKEELKLPTSFYLLQKCFDNEKERDRERERER